MRELKTLVKLSKWLVVLGAINWGLVALMKFNLVTLLFGQWPVMEMWVYTLVGAAGVWGAFAMLTNTKKK